MPRRAGRENTYFDMGSVEVRLQDNEAKRSVELSHGDKLVLRLDSNPSTGYQWQVSLISGNVLDWVEGPSYLPSEPSLIGSGGTASFGFLALKKGRASLKLIYRRPWEEGKPPARTVVLKVWIK
jgi:inhibitor of cysteine peptidase